jgi:adenylate cyclase
MKQNFRFPIYLKLILVTVFILLSAMGPVAYLTSDYFKKASAEREKLANLAEAETRAGEVTSFIQGAVNRGKTLGTMLLKARTDATHTKAKPAAETATDPVEFQFQQEAGLVALEVFERKDGNFVSLRRLANDKYLKNAKLEPEYLNTVTKKVPFPIAAPFAGEVTIKNRSLPKGLPLLSLGIPLATDDSGKVTHAAVADIDLMRLQKSFAVTKVNETYLVDKDGTTLAHPREEFVLSAKRLTNIKVVKDALSASVAKGQVEYFSPERKDTFIAAYARTSMGPAVVSEASQKLIFEPARRIQRNVLRIMGLAMSVAIIITFLFSSTLTRPIEQLVVFTREIARGNFNLMASATVRSLDEVGTLAASFDQMVDGLKERDKVKNLFSKFHGSSVAESLIQNGEAKVGGSRKSVVVFFSDIRGFTAFSESRTPEQVVAMLNEYFSAMVRIIYRNNGIVDKFIGDAIMAIWGAPQTTGDDPYYAVKTCVEMRQAIEELNKVRQGRGEEPIKIGIGLHLGDAISGTIGSEDRMEYTVIGDTVNMTSRIEGATKAFGADCLISEDLAEKVKNQFICEAAGACEVKGKSEPLKLYKVRGYKDAEGKEIIVKTEWSDYTAEKADKAKVI